jgi:hypothetical protein
MSLTVVQIVTNPLVLLSSTPFMGGIFAGLGYALVFAQSPCIHTQLTRDPAVMTVGDVRRNSYMFHKVLVGFEITDHDCTQKPWSCDTAGPRCNEGDVGAAKSSIWRTNSIGRKLNGGGR